MEKISLFLLPTVRFSRPTRFCSIYYYIHPTRHLLTYSLTYRYLLTCAIVCVLVCLFVWLFFLFLKRSGLVFRSCPVSLSPFDFHIESSKCCDPWISGLAWRTITQFWGPWFMVLSESIREKTESNLAANISIHIVTYIVTCQRMILRGERLFSGWADAFLRLF